VVDSGVDDEDDDLALKIALPVVLIVLLLFVVIVIFCYCRRKGNRGVKGGKSSYSNPSYELKE